MSIVLKGGQIVTAVDTYFSDLRIEGEKIVSIGENIEKPGDEVISAKGCYILPGGIDTHTHFDLNVGATVTADNFESGTKAAIVGGTTTILDFATQNKGETLKQALKNWHDKSDNLCYSDYGFHMAITDWNDAICEEMEDMIKEGVTSFKLYMAYKNTLQVEDGTIFKALRRSKEIGGLICFHCENGDIIEVLVNDAKLKGLTTPIYHALTRPVEVEREAITRLLQLAEMADAAVYIVHLSSEQGFLSIMDGKKRGVKVYVETCPQYLLLNDSYYGKKEDKSFEAAKYVISPPLRKSYDQETLWKALKAGEISTIGSDHCSFNYKKQKYMGINDFTKIPNGAPGVENRFMLMYTYGVCAGKITLNEMVAVTSTNAAKIFGLFPRKGTIAVGSDADLVVLDSNSTSYVSVAKLVQRVDYTPYEGFKYKGKIKHVFLRGNKVVENSMLCCEKTMGIYLSRNKL